MLRTATSRLQPFGVWMPDLIVLRAHAPELSRAALQGCFMPNARTWCPDTNGGLLLCSLPTVVTRPMHSTLVQGMRSTDTQEKEVKNGRLAMVSRPQVLTVLTISAGKSRTTVCSMWPAAAEVHPKLHALQFWEGLQ